MRGYKFHQSNSWHHTRQPKRWMFGHLYWWYDYYIERHRRNEETKNELIYWVWDKRLECEVFHQHSYTINTFKYAMLLLKLFHHQPYVVKPLWAKIRSSFIRPFKILKRIEVLLIPMFTGCVSYPLQRLTSHLAVETRSHDSAHSPRYIRPSLMVAPFPPWYMCLLHGMCSWIVACHNTLVWWFRSNLHTYETTRHA